MGKINKAKRRQQLFEVYSTNLSFYSNAAGRFVCPICEAVFGAEALQKPLQVDIAHVYPASCGGKPETMTCSACNSRMGHTYDHHIATDHRYIEAFRRDGKGKVRARMHFEGGSAGVEFSANGGGFHFNVIGSQTNPKEQQALIALSQRRDFKFELTFPAPDPSYMDVAILHSAYWRCSVSSATSTWDTQIRNGFGES
jgi:hypothetical protein